MAEALEELRSFVKKQKRKLATAAQRAQKEARKASSQSAHSRFIAGQAGPSEHAAPPISPWALGHFGGIEDVD